MGLSKSLSQELSLQVCCTLDGALRRWRDGLPKAEVALLNHISGSFRRARCGLTPLPHRAPMRVKAALYNLHQAGGKVGQKTATDAYGSDIAVHVRVERVLSGRVVPSRSFSKTAFVQLKKATSKSRTVKLDRDQLLMAAAIPEVRTRAFVAAAYEAAGFPVIKDVDSALYQLRNDPKKQKKRTAGFDTTDGSWAHVFHWAYDWLRCRVGPYDSPATVALLHHLYRVRVPAYPEEPRDMPRDLPYEWLPPPVALVFVVRVLGAEAPIDDFAGE